MTYIFLTLIKVYWFLIPASNRKKCIFKKSCSNYVFDKTKNGGFIAGLKAFKFRHQNCRNGFELFKNPITGETQMILPNMQVIGEEKIAERFRK